MISILPATPEDAETLATVGVLAFSQDGLQKSIFEHFKGSSAEQAEHIRWRTDRTRHRMDGPGRHWFKAVDDTAFAGDGSPTGRIIGAASVYAPDVGTSGKAAPDPPIFLNRETCWIVSPAGLTRPKPRLWVTGRTFGVSLVSYCQSLSAYKRPGADVPSLLVHPDYRGQGIAKRLLDGIFALADQQGGLVYLESSPAAKGMYLHCGFRVVGEIDLLPGEYSLYPMLRDAQ